MKVLVIQPNINPTKKDYKTYTLDEHILSFDGTVGVHAFNYI